MSQEVVLITGGSGMYAQALAEALTPTYQVRFLSRKADKPNHFLWDIDKGYIANNALIGVQHIVHLVGASIGEKRWTKSRKQEILDSRITSAKLLFQSVKQHNIKLKTFVSASAVGYYGSVTSQNIYTENSTLGNDFLSDVCQQWEQAADAFTEVSDRVLKLRLGVILSNRGGILATLLPIFNKGLAQVIGNGKQWIPWIDLDDLVRVTLFLMHHNLTSGIYNVVAPEHITNKKFTHTLAKIVGKRVVLPALPAIILKIILGEASVLMLEGSRVEAQRLEELGFEFQCKTLEQSLRKWV